MSVEKYHQTVHWIAVIAVYASLAAASFYEGCRFIDQFALSQRTKALSPVISAQSSNSSTNVSSAATRSLFRSSVPLVVLFSLSLVAVGLRDFVWNHPGVILVFLGVAGENAWDAKETGGMKAMYQISAAVLIAGLVVEMSEAVQADAKLTDAKSKIAEVNERAETLRKETEELRKANALLMASTGPRSFRMTLEAEKRLKEFLGTEVELSHLADLECKGAAHQILFLLGQGQWKCTDPIIIPLDAPASAAFLDGVVVYAGKNPDAARALVSVLTEGGLSARLGNGGWKPADGPMRVIVAKHRTAVEEIRRSEMMKRLSESAGFDMDAYLKAEDPGEFLMRHWEEKRRAEERQTPPK